MRIKHLPASFRTTKAHTGHKRVESRSAADFWPIVMALSTDGHPQYGRMKNGRSLFVSGRDGALGLQHDQLISERGILCLQSGSEVNSGRKKHRSATIVADRYTILLRNRTEEISIHTAMKTLFLIRHAKSSWDDTGLPDKDRPLSDRGKRDAPKMGKRLAKRDVKPDLILSSPARRALTTAEIIAKKLDYKRKNIVVEGRLYSSAVDDLLNVVQKLSDKLERVMLFGHNPELTEFARRLSSEISHMPTCAVAKFMFSAKSWSNIGKVKLAKVVLDYPKKSKGKASSQ